MSPTQRTLALYRSEGWEAEVVERWIPRARIRRDLAGFVDVFCWKPGQGFLGVQATTASNLSSRLNKITAEPRALSWLRAGAAIHVIGWKKGGPRGSRKTWGYRRVMLGIVDGRVAEMEIR